MLPAWWVQCSRRIQRHWTALWHVYNLPSLWKVIVDWNWRPLPGIEQWAEVGKRRGLFFKSAWYPPICLHSGRMSAGWEQHADPHRCGWCPGRAGPHCPHCLPHRQEEEPRWLPDDLAPPSTTVLPQTSSSCRASVHFFELRLMLREAHFIANWFSDLLYPMWSSSCNIYYAQNE